MENAKVRSVRVRDSDWKLFRVNCILDDKTTGDVINELIDEYNAKRDNKTE